MNHVQHMDKKGERWRGQIYDIIYFAMMKWIEI